MHSHPLTYELERFGSLRQPTAAQGARVHLPQSAKPPPVVWPAVALLYAALLPPEAVFDLGDFRLYGYRLLLLILTPLIFVHALNGKHRWGWIDGLVAFSGIWMTIAFLTRYGEAGLESGGAQSFDFIAAYLVGRCWINSPYALRRLLYMAVPGVLLMGMIMLAESVSGRLLIRPVFAALSGGLDETHSALRLEYRLGLLRAFGSFPHPILGGLQMTSFIPLFLLCMRRSYWQKIGVFGAGLGIFTWSSAAIIGSVLNLALPLYERVRAMVRELSWPLLVWGSVLLLFVIHFTSQNGVFSVVIRYLTFDAWTGYYRMLTWQYGSANVVANPFMGLGFEEWDRPQWMFSSTVDAHWLLTAMRFGLPAAVAHGVAALAIMFRLSKRASHERSGLNRRCFVGLCISLFTVNLLMFTVTLWSNSYAWYMMLLGAGAALGIRRPRMRRILVYPAGAPEVPR